MSASGNKKGNNLVHESSPYLLQHAYNPVDWFAFSDEVFDRAKKENKPVLISIGYSACHWCHVMEHESFEDEGVAALMNKYFINVKVDREERTDVDNLYMQAVQMMSGHGGWPLNCFVLPDGRPFYGGTYFPKEQWLRVLQGLANLYENDKEKVLHYAEELTEGIKKSEDLLTVEKIKSPVEKASLQASVRSWKRRMDNTEGGPDKAPKFPLPSNYQFLMRYALLEKDHALQEHVELTLKKMAFGGIFDQIHGGFCRYSTDKIWKVPHFEKMLYDNAQLVSLYTEAFLHTGNVLYKKVAIETLEFVLREWYHEAGFFYSALDADSEGEEGKYYVWSEEELKSLLKEDYDLFSQYYLINEKGYWEHNNYILMRNEDIAQLNSTYGAAEVLSRIEKCREILRNTAKSRTKPGLDDKMITSWNALMCSAFAHAYLAFGDEKYKKIALHAADFLTGTMWEGKKTLYRSYKNGEKKIPGFLDDYAFTIECLIQTYVLSGDESRLNDAQLLLRQALEKFANAGSSLLYYTPVESSNLVARTTEIADNVIGSSNSQMAINLFVLSRYFANSDWALRAEEMLSYVTDELMSYGSAYSNWGCLALNFLYPFREVAIVGKNVDEIFAGMRKRGHTNTIFALASAESALPLVKDRYVAGNTLIYVCQNNTCLLPVKSVEEALKQLE